jgi:hypothetical protein
MIQRMPASAIFRTGASPDVVSTRFRPVGYNRRRAAILALWAGLAFTGAAADELVDARQILLPIDDIAADAAWSIFGDGESYARSLQDLTADLSRHDGQATAAFAVTGGHGDALTVRLKSGAPPQGARLDDHVVHVWARAVQPTGASFRVALLQGEQELWVSGLWNATSSFAEMKRTVPQHVATAITNYQNVRLRFYAQGKPLYLTKAYLEVGADQAPDLGHADTPVWAQPVNVLQFELDPLATGVSWVEDRGSGRTGELFGFCSALDQQTARPRPVGDARGVSMGRTTVTGTPQTGRRAQGPFAVMLDHEGYIVTCDIDEANPAQSVVTRWAGPGLDPLDVDPDARSERACIFATKDYTQSDRIVVYQYRDPDDDGGDELYLVNLDQDPLTHIRIWDPPPPPAGDGDGLTLSTQRTLDATPYWFWGCFASTAPDTPVGVCRIDLRDLPNVVVEQVIQMPERVLYGWPFVGTDGRQRWIAGFNSPGGDPALGEPGMRLYVEAEPQWVVEEDYPIDTDLWAPSFAVPGRGQTPEVAGPDAQGRYFVVYSTHDVRDARAGFDVSQYGKIVAAVIGEPGTAAVVSRKQNHQVQTEAEPFILNGRLQVFYTETQTGPTKVPDDGVLQERLIDLSGFPAQE